MIKKRCLYCGKEFVAPYYGAKYCSYLCYRLDVFAEMKNRYESEKEVIK